MAVARAQLLVPLATTAALGCSEPDQATIVAVRGCEIAEDIFGLRVQTRGDFPPGSAARAVLTEATALLGRDVADIDGVTGVTVEGLVGDDVVGAVGRTTRLQRNGEISVYFAGINSLCEAAKDEFSEAYAPGAMAVAPLGDVLIVGGRGGGGLVDTIVHVTDDTNAPRVVNQRLPMPATGQSLHAVGDRSFLLIGGAGPGPTASAESVRIDVDEDGGVSVGAPIVLEGTNVPKQPRAHHGAARWRNLIFVTGGCSEVDGGRCRTDAGSVLSSSLVIDPSMDPPGVGRGRPLREPRYGHQLHVARDQVLFVVGGRGVGGVPLREISRLLPAPDEDWEDYGPTLEAILPDGIGIEGSALLEGGLLVLALSDGKLRWVSEDATGELDEWCRYGPDDASDEQPPRRDLPGVEMQESPGGELVPIPPCFVGQQFRPDLPRLIHALPGERILADNYVVPMASPGLGVDDILETSGGPRTGGLAATLADGTIMLAGGYAPPVIGSADDPDPPIPLRPLVRRLRPPLDGPDERIPSLNDADRGAFVSVSPDRVSAVGGTLEIRTVEAARVPTARARVRGFRSRSFRFEVTLAVSGAQVEPHIIVEQGAVAAVSVRLGNESIRGFARAPWGGVVEFGCGSMPDGFWSDNQPRTVQVDVRPDSFVLSHDGTVLGRCPIQDLDVPVTVGVGASGFSGTVTARSFRLSRI